MTQYDERNTTTEKNEATPDFGARRLIAAGATVLAVLGVWKATELVVDATVGVQHSISQTDFDQHGCSLDGKAIIMDRGQTVWNTVAEPFAREHNMPVDEADSIIATANPSITSLGNVAAGTVILIPTCK
jgi:hypothetical protein